MILKKCYLSYLESFAAKNIDAINFCLIAEGNRTHQTSHQAHLRNSDLVTVLYSH